MKKQTVYIVTFAYTISDQPFPCKVFRKKEDADTFIKEQMESDAKDESLIHCVYDIIPSTLN